MGGWPRAAGEREWQLGGWAGRCYGEVSNTLDVEKTFGIFVSRQVLYRGEGHFVCCKKKLGLDSGISGWAGRCFGDVKLVLAVEKILWFKWKKFSSGDPRILAHQKLNWLHVGQVPWVKTIFLVKRVRIVFNNNFVLGGAYPFFIFFYDSTHAVASKNISYC